MERRLAGLVEVQRPAVETAPLADDHAPGSSVRHVDAGYQVERSVLYVEHAAFGHPNVSRSVHGSGHTGQRRRGTPFRAHRRAGVTEGVHAVALRFSVEKIAHLDQSLGLGLGQVAALREIVGDVVKLPFLLWAVEGQTGETHPRDPPVEAGGHEAIVVDAPVAEHFEVLSTPMAHRSRVVERVGH